MYISNYINTIIRNDLLKKNNIYNKFNSPKLLNINIILQLNTFQNEKNFKIIRLFNLIFFITKQRPFLKKVKFTYVKKQIMKSFHFYITLRKNNKYNFIIFYAYYYMYFYNIYYKKNIKYNYTNSLFWLYVDNIQSQFRNYNKSGYKSQFKVIFNANSKIKNLLNNFNIINIA